MIPEHMMPSFEHLRKQSRGMIGPGLTPEQREGLERAVQEQAQEQAQRIAQTRAALQAMEIFSEGLPQDQETQEVLRQAISKRQAQGMAKRMEYIHKQATRKPKINANVLRVLTCLPQLDNILIEVFGDSQAGPEIINDMDLADFRKTIFASSLANKVTTSRIGTITGEDVQGFYARIFATSFAQKMLAHQAQRKEDVRPKPPEPEPEPEPIEIEYEEETTLDLTIDFEKRRDVRYGQKNQEERT